MCPRCRRLLPDATASLSSGRLPRCPEHGLAFVEPHEVEASGGDTLLGTSVAGRFVIIGWLGAGSMGAVYRARQEAVGRDVALKIVRRERAYDAETQARFEREARATSVLVSPYTVTVFDFGESEDGSWYLAMELLEGETLGERLKRVGRMPVEQAVRIAREALRSLAEAHGKGIVHRDLKPDNLFLTRAPADGTAAPGEICKVLDFGIAKLVRGDAGVVDQLETQAGTVFGTPRYMSPEQAQGAPLDARSDLYSLGVILYQMLSGRAPFVDDDAVVVMARHIKDAPPRLAEVAPHAGIPPVIEAVVRRALAKSPAARPQSAEQFAQELEQALTQSALGTGLHATWAGPPAGAELAGPSRGRGPLLLGALVVLVAALGLLGFFLVRSLARPATAGAPPASASAIERPSAPLASATVLFDADDAGSSAAAADAAAAKPKSVRRPVFLPAPPASPPTPPKPTSSGSYGRFE